MKFTAQTNTDLRTIRHKCAKQSSKQALSLPTNFAFVIVLILRFRQMSYHESLQLMTECSGSDYYSSVLETTDLFKTVQTVFSNRALKQYGTIRRGFFSCGPVGLF